MLLCFLFCLVSVLVAAFLSFLSLFSLLFFVFGYDFCSFPSLMLSCLLFRFVLMFALWLSFLFVFSFSCSRSRLCSFFH